MSKITTDLYSLRKTPSFAADLGLLRGFEIRYREKKIKPFEKPICVTRPFFPPLGAFCDGLSEIWRNGWLTNNGPVLKRFQKKLCEFFETENICLFANGTLALQIALKGMEISGEVITTPFTFVATAHALTWNNIKPVFVILSRSIIRLIRKK